MELRRIELRTSHMRSEHSTSELQPLVLWRFQKRSYAATRLQKRTNGWREAETKLLFDSATL